MRHLAVISSLRYFHLRCGSLHLSCRPWDQAILLPASLEVRAGDIRIYAYDNTYLDEMSELAAGTQLRLHSGLVTVNDVPVCPGLVNDTCSEVVSRAHALLSTCMVDIS